MRGMMASTPVTASPFRAGSASPVSGKIFRKRTPLPSPAPEVLAGQPVLPPTISAKCRSIRSGSGSRQVKRRKACTA